jgi:sporulation protein YlmC with PRC-barrel domain
MTALALVLGLAAAPAIAQSDKASGPKTSAAVTGCVQAGAQVSAEAFNALDDNGDGYITQEEYIEKCGKAGAVESDGAAKAHFAALDRNRDQKLTQDEFKSPAVKQSDAGSASGAMQSRADASSAPNSPSGAVKTDRDNMSGSHSGASAPTATTSGSSTASGAPALASIDADKVIGMDVVNAKGDEVGEVKDLVLDKQQVAHAVVSVGGFLGIGAKDVAVPFQQLRVGPDNVILMSEASESELKQMPAYDKKQYSSVQHEDSRKAAPTPPRAQPKQ